MKQPADLTIQQWIETIRHAKDAEEIATLAAVFDQVFHAAPLDDSARVDALLAAGEILSEKGLGRKWKPSAININLQLGSASRRRVA